MSAPLDLDHTRDLTAANGAPAREPDVWDARIDDFNPMFGHTPEPEPLQESPSLVAADFSVDRYLTEERTKDLLRFSTAGSVDDGKSTLIGRLLYDTQSVYDDQLQSIEGKGTTAPGVLDLALLTDGLRAEREQGITIDVAYRYFTTAKRKFIIADTPGHEQYTRNMATGASTASLAIVLVDARKGVLIQSRRHACITALLGVPHLVVAVNKMDLVAYDEATFRAIEQDFRAFFARIEAEFGHENPPTLHFVPVSALAGDNVVTRSEAMPWHTGPTLLQVLESVPSAATATGEPFRLAVQRVLRPNLDFRGFAGQIAAGTIAAGDRIRVLPSGRESTVARIVTFDGDLARAHAPQSVTLTLSDEVDVSRGDLLVSPRSPATATTRFTATLVWMNETPLDPATRYLLKHTSRTVTARIARLHYRLDVATLDRLQDASLGLNGIGSVDVETAQALVLDTYAGNRTTGSFVLIDPQTNATVAAGMVRATSAKAQSTIADARPLPSRSEAEGTPVSGSESAITAEERAAKWAHTAARLHLSGDPAFFAQAERTLFHLGCFIVRPQSPSAVAIEALLDAGALVLTTSEAVSRSTVVDNRLLSITTTEALLAYLRETGVLLSHDHPLTTSLQMPSRDPVT